MTEQAEQTEQTEQQLVTVTATCHTLECGNAGHALVVDVAAGADPVVICGPCGQQITDVT